MLQHIVCMGGGGSKLTLYSAVALLLLILTVAANYNMTCDVTTIKRFPILPVVSTKLFSPRTIFFLLHGPGVSKDAKDAKY